MREIRGRAERIEHVAIAYNVQLLVDRSQLGLGLGAGIPYLRYAVLYELHTIVSLFPWLPTALYRHVDGDPLYYLRLSKSKKKSPIVTLSQRGEYLIFSYFLSIAYNTTPPFIRSASSIVFPLIKIVTVSISTNCSTVASSCAFTRGISHTPPMRVIPERWTVAW